MRKRPIVVVVLILLCVYSYVKQNMLVKRLDGVKQNSAIVSLVDSNVREASSYTGLLNVSVGGFTPAAPSTDPGEAAFIEEVRRINRPWSAEGAAKEAARFAPREGVRIGDAIKAGFRANNAGLNAYTWLNTYFKDDFDPAFKMSDNKDLTDGIPPDMQRQFSMAGSRANAELIRESIIKSLIAEKSLADAGVVGLGAGLFAGVMDVDVLILILFTLFGLPHLTKWFCRSDCKR